MTFYLNLDFLKRNCLIFLYLFIHSLLLFSQPVDCEKIVTFLNEKETQIARLNLHDPDYIPLHFLVAKDITKELEQFRTNVLPYFTECITITFSELINKYDELKNDLQIKHDSLFWLNENIHLIFYEQALYEYQIHNDADAEYLLQRSLQYNDTFPDAILLKLNKLLKNNHFEACLSLLHSLYYETQLDRAQEMQAIEFTAQFYNKLYNTADSLIKIERAAEALTLFEVLERFCLNLPTSYCNDDYFHGVLRSKSGIYESYIAIAKVAEKRGNNAIAAHFYKYAEEYLDGEPYLQKAESTKGRTDEGENGGNNFSPTPNANRHLMTEEVKSFEDESTKAEKDEVIKEKYDNLVMQALGLCIREELMQSYKMFLEAKKLEDCNCFNTDFRVDLMIRELKKILE